MRTNDEALLKIKYNVLHEVAKLAFSGELDEKRDEKPSSAAVYIKKERSSARESVWLRGNVPAESIATI